VGSRAGAPGCAMNEAYDHTIFPIDTLLLERLKTSSYAFEIYETSRIEIVLGRAAKAEQDLHLERCQDDGVPIHRRAGGGGTVVLSPGVIILSVGGKSRVPYQLREHMRGVNERIIEVLGGLGVRGLSHEGISDIALHGRKILGSSLYRSRDLVLYQGSLLLHPDLSLMDRYLRQPDRQPAYRRGRPHGQFVTSLRLAGYSLTTSELVNSLKKAFQERAPWPSVPRPDGA
jgi:lipoate-protein ligase A